MLKFLLVILFVTGIYTNASPFPPSAKLIVTEDGLNKLMSSTIPYIISKIGTLRLAPISILNIDITNIQIQNMEISPADARVDLTPGFFTVYGNNLHMIVTADFTVNYFFFKSTGSVVATGNGTSFSVMHNVSLTDDDIYQLEVTDCEVDITTFSLKITGDDVAKFADKIEGLFNGIIKLAVQSTVANTLKSIVPYILNSILLNIPTDLPVTGTNFSADLSAAQVPVFTENYFEAFSNFYVYENGNKSRPPIPAPRPFPQIEVKNDVTMMLSQYTLDSISYSIYQSGIRFPISHDVIPSTFPFKLTTSSLDALVHGLKERYGADKPIDLDCYANAPPSIRPGNNSLLFDLNTACDNLVVDAQSNSTARAFTLNFALHMNLSLSLVNNSLHANLNDFRLSNSSVTNTDLSSDTQGLESLINLLFDQGKAAIDKYIFSHALPIPQFPNIRLDDVVFEVIDDTIILGGTPRFDSKYFVLYE